MVRTGIVALWYGGMELGEENPRAVLRERDVRNSNSAGYNCVKGVKVQGQKSGG